MLLKSSDLKHCTVCLGEVCAYTLYKTQLKFWKNFCLTGGRLILLWYWYKGVKKKITDEFQKSAVM